MKALLCKAFGPASSLVLEDLPSPEPKKNEVLIEVHAAGVNFPDTLIIEGKYQFKPPFPFAPGGEAAVIVAAQSALAGRPGVLTAARGLSHFGEHSFGWLAVASTGAVHRCSNPNFTAPMSHIPNQHILNIPTRNKRTPHAPS